MLKAILFVIFLYLLCEMTMSLISVTLYHYYPFSVVIQLGVSAIGLIYMIGLIIYCCIKRDICARKIQYFTCVNFTFQTFPLFVIIFENKYESYTIAQIVINSIFVLFAMIVILYLVKLNKIINLNTYRTPLIVA
jgi:hypothetical protein